MFNIGDQVKVIDNAQLLNKVGTITEAVPPNKIVDIAMYDVQIDNEVYVYFDDELQLVTP